MEEWRSVSAGADAKANAQGGGALQRSHGAPMEPLEQLGDALGSEGGVGVVHKRRAPDTTELVFGQAASIAAETLTKKGNHGGRRRTPAR